MVFDRWRQYAREWVFLRSPRPLPDSGLFPADPQEAVEPSGNEAFSRFQRITAAMTIRRAVEFGTAQAVPGRSTHSLAAFPKLQRSNYTMVDIKPGADVDIVADLHSLPSEWSGVFDACIANAVFEHLERPWIAAKEVARILAPGGACYISTHQTFPLHGYPKDFFRFSTDALSLIFSDAGLEVLAVEYAHRTKIILPAELLPNSELDAWNREFPSYALVMVAARKPTVALSPGAN